MLDHLMRTLAAMCVLASLALNTADASQAYFATCCTIPSAISVINRSTHTVTQTLLAGEGAAFVSLTRDGKTAYVANEDAMTISVLDTATGGQTGSIALTSPEGTFPYASVLSPDGTRLFVLAGIGIYGDIGLIEIDTASNEVVFSAAIPGGLTSWQIPAQLPAPAISADGRTLYVAAAQLIVFDITTHTVTGTIPLPPFLGREGFAVSADASYAIITSNATSLSGARFILVDLTAMAIALETYLPPDDEIGPVVFSPGGHLAYFTVGLRATRQLTVSVFDLARRQIVNTFLAGYGTAGAIAITPDGQELEIGNQADDTVISINTAAGTVTATTATLGQILTVTVSPDGQSIYAPDYESALIDVMDPSSGQILSQIAAPSCSPQCAVRASAGGGLAVVAGVRNLSVIDTTSPQLAGVVALGGTVRDIALAPDGSLAYVLNSPYQVAPLIQVVNTQTLQPVAKLSLTTDELFDGHLAISPDGNTLYVTAEDCPSSCAQEILYVDTASLQITGRIVFGPGIALGEIAVSRDGSTAYVAAATEILVVNLPARQVRSTLPLSPSASVIGIALAPNQQYLYATIDYSTYVIDTGQLTVVANLQPYINISGLAPVVSPNSELVYETTGYFDQVQLIEAPPYTLPQILGTMTLPAPATGVAFVGN